MTSSVLHSNHVNYLIWRYLQESGYGRAAVQLSRDWRVTNPQEFDFANTVNPHALVSLIQHGLLYDELTADVSSEQAQEQRNIQSPADTCRRYNFLEASQQRKRRASHTSDRQDDSRPSSSHQQEGTRRKKPRIDTNGARAQALIANQGRRKSSKTQTPIQQNDFEPMDVDRDSSRDEAIQTADDEEVEPVKEEPPPRPHTLEIGQSTGTQSDPVIDRTIAKSHVLFTVPKFHNELPDIVRTEWDPDEPDMLNLCGGSVWRSYKIPGDKTVNGVRESPPYVERLQRRALTTVFFFSTAARASPNHPKRLAYAIEEGNTNTVMSRVVLDDDGTRSVISNPTGTVLALQFNAPGTHLLALVSSQQKHCLDVWDLEEDQDLETMKLSRIAHDATWTGGSTFVTSGDSCLDFWTVTNGLIEHVKGIETSRQWERIGYNGSGKVAGISPGDGYLCLIDTHTFVFQEVEAHADEIEGFQWQPTRNVESTAEEGSSKAEHDTETGHSRVVATSCVDGTLKLWSTEESLECAHNFSMSPRTPLMALSFSPDGALIAAAGQRRVQVWKAKGDFERVAHWQQDEEDDQDIQAAVEDEAQVSAQKAANDRSNDDPPFHLLSWHTSSKLLAYTQRDKVAVIELPSEQE